MTKDLAPILLPGPTAILCDLGMVLVDFDRTRLHQGFPKVFSRPFPLPKEKQLDCLRLDFEQGVLSTDEFSSAALQLLELPGEARSDLRQLWTSIFTPNKATIALLRQAATRPDTSVVVVSDTDPWCEHACANQFGLADLMHDAVCSYQEGVNSKRVDASMWLKAGELASAQLDSTPGTIIAIDDISEHLDCALAARAATHTHLFTSADRLATLLASLAS